MNQDLAISLRTSKDVSIIDLKGELTGTTAEIVESAYHTVTHAGAKKILFVFTRESYINSGGIASLITITSDSREKEQVLRITGLSPHFQKILDIVGLIKYVTLFPTEEAALKDF